MKAHVRSLKALQLRKKTNPKNNCLESLLEPNRISLTVKSRSPFVWIKYLSSLQHNSKEKSILRNVFPCTKQLSMKTIPRIESLLDKRKDKS